MFDRNKGAIYALYSRALREQPELQGKLVLEFTIAPTGEVTMCRVVSSELNDPELESKIVARVRLFHFEAKDVESITTTKPIDFFPVMNLEISEIEYLHGAAAARQGAAAEPVPARARRGGARHLRARRGAGARHRPPALRQ